jgi:ribonuclease Z
VPDNVARNVVARHVSPEQAGTVFSRTRPRLAVYSHIAHAIATDADLVPATRRTYAGPLEVGADLMVITIGDRIDVRRPASANR